MRYFYGVLTFGFALGLVAGGATVYVMWPDTPVQHQVQVIEREMPAPERVVLERLSPADLAEVDRQSDCLYDYLREHVGTGITFEAVWYGGLWTDQLGGACAVMGR